MYQRAADKKHLVFKWTTLPARFVPITGR